MVGDHAATSDSMPVQPSWFRRHQSVIAILVIAVVLRALAFDPWTTINIDELMQYLERAYRMVTGHGIVTWEERYGIRNWIIPQILAIPVWFGATFAPGTIAAVIAARLTAALINLTAVVSAYAIGRRQSEQHGLVAAFAVAVWFPCIYYSISLLSESLGASAILGGLALIFGGGQPIRRLAIAGFLLGLGVLLRFPYVVFVGVVVMGTCRTDLRKWMWIGAGFAAAGVLGILSDLIAGQTPFLWLLRNIQQNIFEGRAASNGIRMPFYYPLAFVGKYGFGMACILVLALLCPARYRLLLLAALTDVVMLSVLAHKELRFVYLSTCIFVILAALASVDVFNQHTPQNLRTSPLARAAPYYLWVILSLTSWLGTNDFTPIETKNLAAQLAQPAIRDGQVCGLAMSDRYRFGMPRAIIGPGIPLYSEVPIVQPIFLPDPVVIPEAVASAANAIVASGKARLPSGYRPVRCLFIRPGPCDPARASKYELQNVLIASDL
jgi:hypothetical protein